jgi:hypothetical protein
VCENGTAIEINAVLSLISRVGKVFRKTKRVVKVGFPPVSGEIFQAEAGDSPVNSY